jgi:membrane-associated phospholipid phosphatase
VRNALVVVAALVTLALCPRAASAQELRTDAAIDIAVIGGGGAAWITSEVLKKDLAPSSCRWCGTNGFDTSVRDAVRWSDPSTANVTSNVLGFAAVPALALGGDALAALHDDRARGFGADSLVIVEAGVLAADVNQLTKFIVGRQRPCARFADPAHPCTGGGPDDNVSFFSGHTSVTMALGVASAQVAQMRGYRWAPILWAALPALSVLTGYLRIAADEHWATDVLTGAVLGAGIGFSVPYVFHRPLTDGAAAGSARASLSVAPLGVSGVW